MFIDELQAAAEKFNVELNDEHFDRQLLSCVKVYLWRHIKYDTKLTIPPSVVTNSLTKE